MKPDPHSPIKLTICAPVMGRDLDPVRAVHPGIELIDGNEAFSAYRQARKAGDTAAAERAVLTLSPLLAEADIVCMMYPVIPTIRALAPKMRWLHHSQAGVSNLMPCDVWEDSSVLITSGRGHVRPTAIAEYCMAALMGAARGLNDAHIDKQRGELNPDRYRPVRIAGASLGIIGFGGIGREIARLARALGMRVIATRRSVDAAAAHVDGADLLLPASELKHIARDCDFIALSAALTPETRRLLNADFFDALARRPVLVNISRGELIDEDAMLEALTSDRLTAAILDVYDGELEGRPPRPELVACPKLLLTPHISGLGSEADSSFMDLFCENLRRYLDGEDVINRVDRARGY